MAKRRNGKASRKHQVDAEVVNQQAQEEYGLEKGVKFKKHIEFKSKTRTQEEFVGNIRNNEVTIGIGPAGVGKTFCAATVAAQMLSNHDIGQIVLTRANETIGKSIGMLPGTIEEKMAPLLQPILSVLERQLGDAVYNYCLRKQKIVMLPFEYVRGRSFKDTFVIVDESQNLTEDDVIAICTRYESGRTVLLGDPFQHDLKNVEPGISWLKNFAVRNEMDIPISEFNIEDVVRSGFVKKFLTALYKERSVRTKKAVLLG